MTGSGAAPLPPPVAADRCPIAPCLPRAAPNPIVTRTGVNPRRDGLRLRILMVEPAVQLLRVAHQAALFSDVAPARRSAPSTMASPAPDKSDWLPSPEGTDGFRAYPVRMAVER